MTSATRSPLIDCEWLADRLNAPELAVLDATFFLPTQRRSASREYLREHLPGAQFFDIDAIADTANPLPHMLPTPEGFAAAVGDLGIGNSSQIVVYDNNQFMASARVWWTFRVFGHDRVAVLDGGLQRWKALGLPLESGSASAAPRSFRADYRPELVRDLAQMEHLLGQQETRIVDARSPGRYAGSEPEPRPGVRSGHIPGSRNVCFRDLIDASGRLKPPAEIVAEFRRSGVDPMSPIVTTCGTGVTAAILALGLFRLGRADVPVYDGSWTEWGGLPDVPVEMGPQGSDIDSEPLIGAGARLPSPRQ